MAASHWLVKSCYALDGSAFYRRAKQFCYSLLEDPHSPMRPYFDITMIVLVVSSVFVIIWEETGAVGPGAIYFSDGALIVFAIEYFLRIWIYSDAHKIIIDKYEHAELLNQPFVARDALWAVLRDKWAYIKTPHAVIDLLAILPSFRAFGFLRFLLLFRLLKVFRYARSLNEFAQVLHEKRFELYTLAMFSGFVVLTASTAMLFFESKSPESQIHTVFDAVYWAVITIFTVGYGDITPHTPEGRVVTIVLVVSGVVVIAFSTSIIVTAFTEKMRKLREDRVFSEIERYDGYTLIGGFGRMGEAVAEKLLRNHEAVIVVDRRADRVELARSRGILALEGDVTDSRLLDNLKLSTHAKRILCLTEDDVSNVYVTLSARQLNPTAEIIARATSNDVIKKLKLAGATHVVTPFQTAALIAAEYIGQPVAFDAVYGALSGTRDIAIDAVPVRLGSRLDGKPVGDIDFAGQHLLLFGVVRASGQHVTTEHHYYDLVSRHFYFNPKAHFVLRAHDILVVFGHSLTLGHFKKELELGKGFKRTAQS